MGKHPWEPSRLSHSNAVTDQQNNHGKTFISLMGIVDTILTSRVMGVHIPGQCWFGSQLNVYLLNKILYQYPLTVVDDSAQYRRYNSCLPAGPTRFWSCRPDSKVAGFGPTGRRKNRTLPWLLKSPEHQQAWYWLCRTHGMYWCYTVNFIYLGQAKYSGTPL